MAGRLTEEERCRHENGSLPVAHGCASRAVWGEEIERTRLVVQESYRRRGCSNLQVDKRVLARQDASLVDIIGAQLDASGGAIRPSPDAYRGQGPGTLQPTPPSPGHSRTNTMQPCGLNDGEKNERERASDNLHHSRGEEREGMDGYTPRKGIILTCSILDGP